MAHSHSTSHPQGAAKHGAHEHHGHEHPPGAGQPHAHHHHHGDPATQGRLFLIAIGLNAGFVAVEFAYGVIAQSTALMADAGHNLSDVLGLVLAWGAVTLQRRAPTARYTYGLRRSSILAALANAALLLVACGAMAWESVHRLVHPPPVAGMTVMVVAGLGMVVNGLSAWLFMRPQSQGHSGMDDLNMRGAYLHMAADAAVSLGVVVAGGVMTYTAWFWIDGVTSLLIVAVILAGTWGLLRESLQLALDAVPSHIDLAQVAAALRALPGVHEVHDLHVWALSTTESAVTAHLVIPEGHPGDAMLDDAAQMLKARFAVRHSTLQVVHAAPAHRACSLVSP